MKLQIGKNIKILRSKHGITQETLAYRLGISPQSISKWERNEGYPDITMTIPIAEYFGVSLDELMGFDTQKKESKIQQILMQLQNYSHMGNHEMKNSLAREAYAEFPFDFRIISWYLIALLDTEEPMKNQREIEQLSSYVLEECVDETIRCEVIMVLIDFYKQCMDYKMAEKYADKLQSIQFSKEFSKCFIYPWDDERDFFATTSFIDETMERILWLLTRIAVWKKGLCLEERIEILEKAKKLSDVLYEDFELGMFHGDEIFLSLFCFYSELGHQKEALYCLEEAFQYSKRLDECANRVIPHTSQPLCGSSFDMRKSWSGYNSSAVSQLFEQLKRPNYCFSEYDDNEQYQNILLQYRSYIIRR